jgi:flagellar biosynthesis protein FlhF
MSHATIRTFRAADARSALAAARDALGPEAVVLQTREVPGSLFRRGEVEVMAALDDADLPPAKQVTRPRAQPATDLTVAPPPRLKLQRGEPLVDSGPSHDEVDSLRTALEETRQLLVGLTAQGRTEQSAQLVPAASEIHRALITRGLEPADAARLVREALALGTPARPIALLAAVRDLLAVELDADRAPWTRRGRQVLAMVGPTGVGKTTTLAKIAARALLDSRTSVGLITVDTYRVGASEQLARYGEIMGVPAFTAKSAPELRAALERLARCQLILIDTAGRSAQDLVLRQAELVRTVPGVELHLVLSAASGTRELSAIAQRYASLEPDRIAFAKVDEAVAAGSILAATSVLRKKVSCICNGQRVPEDIHAATRSDLVDLVLGSWDR